MAVIRAFCRAFAARDWDALATQLAPTSSCTITAPRVETLHGPTEYIRALRSLVDLSPDVRIRFDHVGMAERGFVCAPTWVGTHEGGASETPSIVVYELDAQGRGRRFDQYDLAQLGERWRDSTPSGASAPRDPLARFARPNAATAAMDRQQAAFEGARLGRLARNEADGCEVGDRRRHVLVSLDVDETIADLQRIAKAAPDARYERELLGTAGDRVDLERVLWRAGVLREVGTRSSISG